MPKSKDSRGNAFLNLFRMPDDDADDYDDDDDVIEEDDDDDEAAEEERRREEERKKREHDKAVSRSEVTKPPKPSPAPRHASSSYRKKDGGNVVDFEDASAYRKNNRGRSEICVVYPTAGNDGSAISRLIMEGKSVIFDLDGRDLADAQQIVDFVSGTCFGIKGDLKQISRSAFIAVPANVELTFDKKNGNIPSDVKTPEISNES